MTVIGVFCRANHPPGYGGMGYTPPPCAPQGVKDFHEKHRKGIAATAAHGYVTLIAKCEDFKELQRVVLALRNRWFPWYRRTDDWYAGIFELVWGLEIEIPDFGPEAFKDLLFASTWSLDQNLRDFDLHTYNSYGDNRACAYLSAAEVLEIMK